MKLSPITNNIFKNKTTPTNFKGIRFEYDIEQTSIFKDKDQNDEIKLEYNSTNENKNK